MQAIFFALVAFFGWGIGDIFGTITTRKIGSYSTTFWYLIIALMIEGFYALTVLDQLKNFTPSLLIFTFAIGAIGTAGLVTFCEALKEGNAALVGTICGSFAAISVPLSIVFLKESITLIQLISIIVIFAGVILTSIKFENLKQRKIIATRGTLLAVITMIAFGIYWAFIKVPIVQVGWFWPGYIASTPSLLIPVFLWLKKTKITRPNYKGALSPLILNSILLPMGAFSLNFALQKGSSPIVTPIAGAYPVLFVLLAFFIFKDPITRQQISGIVITLIGIILLSIFSI